MRTTWWRFWNRPGRSRQGAKPEVAYRLHYTLGEPLNHRTGTVLDTRNSAVKPGAQRFVIDFGFQGIGKGEGESGPPPRAVVTATKGEAGPVTLTRGETQDVWRMSFDVGAAGKDPVELTAFLQRGGNIETETWSYTWRP